MASNYVHYDRPTSIVTWSATQSLFQSLYSSSPFARAMVCRNTGSLLRIRNKGHAPTLGNGPDGCSPQRGCSPCLPNAYTVADTRLTHKAESRLTTACAALPPGPKCAASTKIRRLSGRQTPESATRDQEPPISVRRAAVKAEGTVHSPGFQQRTATTAGQRFHWS